jgi:hypothetical protein
VFLPNVLLPASLTLPLGLCRLTGILLVLDRQLALQVGTRPRPHAVGPAGGECFIVHRQQRQTCTS